MPDYGHEIEFGYFLVPDAGDPGRGARDGAPRRPARLRPARRPGPPLPAGASRLARAARRHPRPHGADPRLPGRRKPAPAPTGRVREGGGDARPAQRRALRGRPRRRRLPRAAHAMGAPALTPGESLEALEEAVAILRASWSGARSLRFDGRHYRFERHEARPPARAPDRDLARRREAARAGAHRARRRRLGRTADELHASGEPPPRPRT